MRLKKDELLSPLHWESFGLKYLGQHNLQYLDDVKKNLSNSQSLALIYHSYYFILSRKSLSLEWSPCPFIRYIYIYIYIIYIYIYIYINIYIYIYIYIYIFMYIYKIYIWRLCLCRLFKLYYRFCFDFFNFFSLRITRMWLVCYLCFYFIYLLIFWLVLT